jgi:tetratricopeptide (TPR) repeat protein
MISKNSFTENTKVEVDVFIGKESHGIGFLISVPSAIQQTQVSTGYCLWIGSEKYPSIKLSRNNIEVMNLPNKHLKAETWNKISIEKIDSNLHFSINDSYTYSYVSHLPLTGTHLGVLSRDADFDIKHFKIFSGSLHIRVNCLAVPDAFLANKFYDNALAEYRRIGRSFPGRAESREAMFRAGVTLIEKAKNADSTESRDEYVDLAWEEFEKLHSTPGAPLEYLGKSLVHKALKDNEEEIKCLELAYRKYPNHPVLPILEEQIIFRMHDSSHSDRKSGYRFVLLITRHLKSAKERNDVKKLFTNLKKYWEPLPFLINHDSDDDTLEILDFSMILAFHLTKPYCLLEILKELKDHSPLPTSSLCNGIFCLIEMGAYEEAQQALDDCRSLAIDQSSIELLDAAISSCNKSLSDAWNSLKSLLPSTLNAEKERCLFHLMRKALIDGEKNIFSRIEADIEKYSFSSDGKLQVDSLIIWNALHYGDWNKASTLFNKYPIEALCKEKNILYFLYGCFLYSKEGEELSDIHFSGLLETPFPRSWSLASHYLSKKKKENTAWHSQSFLWERRQLYRQLQLYYTVVGDQGKAKEYKALESKEYHEKK